MKILSAAEMQACDRVTSEQHGVPSIQLMRNASRAVAEFAAERFPGARRIAILCGRGNNGGDGLMTARLLAERGCVITVLLLGDPETMRGDARTALRELLDPSAPEGIALRIVNHEDELAWHSDLLDADLIVDAVLGTGFQPPLRGLPLAALEWLRAAAKLPPVLAVDLPSGWDADSTAATAEAAYPTDAVITFTAPKPAHVFGQLTRFWHQPVVVAGIGSPEAAMVSTQNLHWAGSARALTEKPGLWTRTRGGLVMCW